MQEQETTVSAALGSEHRWINQRFETFRQGLARGQVDADPFAESMKVLHRHIYMEEEILFPVLETRGLVDVTTLLVQEHGEICRYGNAVEALIQRNAGHRRIQTTFKALHSLLEEHNFKEERVLYPAADQILQGRELTQILRQLKETNPPEGWRCRAHCPVVQ